MIHGNTRKHLDWQDSQGAKAGSSGG